MKLGLVAHIHPGIVPYCQYGSFYYQIKSLRYKIKSPTYRSSRLPATLYDLVGPLWRSFIVASKLTGDNKTTNFNYLMAHAPVTFLFFWSRNSRLPQRRDIIRTVSLKQACTNTVLKLFRILPAKNFNFLSENQREI